MKLRLKISLICAAVLLAVVGACSALLLAASRQNILSLAETDAEARQSKLQEAFKQEIVLHGGGRLGPVEKRSLAQYCFKYLAEANDASVLISGGETIVSNLIFDPQDYLPLSRSDFQQAGYANIGGVNVLIVGGRIDVPAMEAQYDIYLAQDISSVYAGITQMVWQFGTVSLVCILIGVTFIIILVSYALKPVGELGESARRIARGEYAGRVKADSRDEIGELARDFNSMAAAVQAHVEELKEVALRQRLFIGGLTHEFKTPLTSVIGHAETLLYTKMPPDAAENSLLTIREQCKWMERLTQKLLKLVTLQEEITLADEPVGPLLEAVRENVSEMLQKRGVTLETRCEAGALPMDFDLMLSLVINLVDNASKASRPGQTVSLRAHGRVIEVEDRGAGIPAGELSRVTEPFYMVDKSRSKKMGGTGLGLALVKRIADAHGAQVAIDSAPGRGTAVKVIFPDNKTFTNP